MICPGTKRPPPIASELESVPAEADGGRGTRGVEYLGLPGEPAPAAPDVSLWPAGMRGAAEGVLAGSTGTGESNVTPSLMSDERSRVPASWMCTSSVSPSAIGSSPRTVAPVSASGDVEEPHDEQKRALGKTCLPQDEQNMEGRFYQRRPRKTITMPPF